MRNDRTGPDPAAAMALIQALSSGGDDGPSADVLMQTIASQSGDPTASMLASLLMNGLGDDEDDEAPDDEFAEIERLLAFAEDESEGPAPAEVADDGELEALREVNDTLADALGACAKCWGGDDGCDACGGDGGPGTAEPDRHLFNELILPAVRRINQTRRARPNLASRSQDPATKEVHHG